MPGLSLQGKQIKWPFAKVVLFRMTFLLIVSPDSICLLSKGGVKTAGFVLVTVSLVPLKCYHPRISRLHSKPFYNNFCVAFHWSKSLKVYLWSISETHRESSVHILCIPDVCISACTFEAYWYGRNIAVPLATSTNETGGWIHYYWTGWGDV